MEFSELEALRRFVAELSSKHAPSLAKYYDKASGGFAHRHDEKKLSKASTGTCVLSLLAAGKWAKGPWEAGASDLVNELLTSRWTSAGLEAENAFSTAWVLETVTALQEFYTSRNIPLKLSVKCRRQIRKAEGILAQSLRSGAEKGAAQLKEYPPSAYLTQLVARVLCKRGKLQKGVAGQTKAWALREINHQLTLLTSKDKNGDVYSLGYSTILLASLSSPAAIRPAEKRLQQTALEHLFKHQLEDDGSWPSSRPLFHYPGAGSAYCFEYEMLVQLLEQSQLQQGLLEHLPNLRKAAYALKAIAFQLDEQSSGWASGHHPQFEGPESWSTASAFHFLYRLDRLVAEAIRQAIFDYADQEYEPPLAPKVSAGDFAKDLLDSEITVDKKPRSLRKVLWESFVQPIADAAKDIGAGLAAPKRPPMSAILYGPPGTSKTELSREIARFLRWPYLAIDPSHLVKGGMDLLQAEANKLFAMLEAAERLVVLFDEFDEMVRERFSANTEVVSRFLTTAMLPKLSRINHRKRIVFLLATNYIDRFDFAISRPGRFDRVFQILPPTTAEKLEKWPKVRERLRTLGADVTQLDPKIKLLTYTEFEMIEEQLSKASTLQMVDRIVDEAVAKCTLERKTTLPDDQNKPTVTWRERCEQQKEYVRI